MTTLLDKQRSVTRNVQDLMTLTSSRSARWTAADTSATSAAPVVSDDPRLDRRRFLMPQAFVPADWSPHERRFRARGA
jgi:hypothetical protein